MPNKAELIHKNFTVTLFFGPKIGIKKVSDLGGLMAEPLGVGSGVTDWFFSPRSD